MLKQASQEEITQYTIIKGRCSNIYTSGYGDRDPTPRECTRQLGNFSEPTSKLRIESTATTDKTNVWIIEFQLKVINSICLTQKISVVTTKKSRYFAKDAR